jgi:polyhydroxyalkanoate synthase
MKPLEIAATLARLGGAVAKQPEKAFEAAFELAQNLTAAAVATAGLARGEKVEPVVEPPADRRFKDSAWRTNPWFFGVGQAYLCWAEWMRSLVDVSGLEDIEAERAAFAVKAVVDAAAPTNFLATNPAALRKAFETGGASVVRGMANFLEDVAQNRGRPRQVDRSAFTVGKDLACTPGKVVFRNELMELIQYAPQTDTVHEVPLLLSPPWINKFYVMDLAPDRSFVEWAVRQGHSVFAISYRDPDESMRDVTLDDYLLDGVGEALDVVCEITGSDTVNVVGLCVGGTLAVMLSSYLTQQGDHRIGSLTLLNTLIDFSQPGPLRVFTDPTAVGRLERRMAKQGYLPAEEMAATFDALRANDLVWNYVASNWLMGEPAPTFDILAWNSDSTRVSEATHSRYLRECYLENRLAKGTLELAGSTIDPRHVKAETYVLAAKEDHITPWKSSYATTQLVSGPVRFVLSSAGHIAGIVNPPSPKRKYWTNDAEPLPADADQWLSQAEEHPGSWWEDWTGWIGARAGERTTPPPLGSQDHPPLDDAPGTYVHAGQQTTRRQAS